MPNINVRNVMHPYVLRFVINLLKRPNKTHHDASGMFVIPFNSIQSIQSIQFTFPQSLTSFIDPFKEQKKRKKQTKDDDEDMEQVWRRNKLTK